MTADEIRKHIAGASINAPYAQWEIALQLALCNERLDASKDLTSVLASVLANILGRIEKAAEGTNERLERIATALEMANSQKHPPHVTTSATKGKGDELCPGH